jgi:hypothetical protein
MKPSIAYQTKRIQNEIYLSFMKILNDAVPLLKVAYNGEHKISVGLKAVSCPAPINFKNR